MNSGWLVPLEIAQKASLAGENTKSAIMRIFWIMRRAALELGRRLVEAGRAAQPDTDPASTPLFIPAAGVVVEIGSLLSHASIVAREIGIPSVVAVPEATRQLRDGDLVEIDGTRGTVHRLA